MVNYGAAFRLPFTNLKRSGIFFLLLLVSSLLDRDLFEAFGVSILSPAGAGAAAIMLFFAIVANGYVLKIANSATHGKNAMPPFGNFLSLAWQGLKLSAAILIYASPIFLIAFIGVFSSWMLLFWIFFFAYLGPMVTVHFAHENRFGALFELGRAFRWAFSKAYFVPWFVAAAFIIGVYALAFIAGGIIALFTLANPLILWLIAVPLGAFIAVILMPTTMNLYGQAYREVTAASAAAVKVKVHKSKK